MARAIDGDAILMEKPFTYFGGQLNDYCEGFLDCAQEAREAINNAPTIAPQWISVEERLPEEHKRVLVYVNGQGSMEDTDRMRDGRWVRWFGRVTHWMPLPEPPEKEAPHE